MTQAALAYLKAHGLLHHAARFDVVAITWPEDAAVRRSSILRTLFAPVGSGQFFVETARGCSRIAAAIE